MVHGLLHVVDDGDRRDGTEDLLAHDLHVGRAAGQHGRRVVMAAIALGALAAKGHRRPRLLRPLDHGLDLAELHRVDDRPHVDIPLGDGIAIGDGSHAPDEALGEVVGHLALDEDAFGAVADLPRIDDARGGDRLHRKVEVGIGKHDGRRLAAKLQVDARQVLRRRLHDGDARRHAAGEADEIDARVTGERRPGGAPRPETMLNTPLGRPTSSASSAKMKALSGVSSLGLMTMVLPATSAGASLRPIR